MSGTIYIPPPQSIISSSDSGYVITITPQPNPTLENYDYYNQTVLIQDIIQSDVTLTTTFTDSITIQ